MARKLQKPQEQSEVVPEAPAPETPEAVITDSNKSASPVTPAKTKPVTVTKLPNGLMIETY